MAALIGGATIHAWGRIPANATDAAHNTQTKEGEGDMDSLFLNAMGMRWIVRISTVSPTLPGLLEAYLRRACSRHPYAKFKRKARAFGGTSVALAGGFWQLPPVKSNCKFVKLLSSRVMPHMSNESLKCLGGRERQTAFKGNLFLKDQCVLKTSQT
eukprot:5927277-Karenia_brevis.AAC.1